MIPAKIIGDNSELQDDTTFNRYRSIHEEFMMWYNRPLENADGALFDISGRYRYILWRTWDNTKPLIAFIGLNPSTANAGSDDPTIRRVKNFAKRWGYGGVMMFNLFAYVTPYPKELKECHDPIKANDHFLKCFVHICDEVVFCWGKFDVFGRDKDVAGLFPTAKALILNKDGSPRHPLYVPKDTELVYFKRPSKKIIYNPKLKKHITIKYNKQNILEVKAKEPMRALTWKEPFGTLMMFGKIETRKWKTDYRGDVLICCGKKPYTDKELLALCGQFQVDRINHFIFKEDLINPGKAIGIATLVDCRKMEKSDENATFVKYSPDLWCHIYQGFRPIRPFDYKGKQGWKKLTQEFIDENIITL